MLQRIRERLVCPACHGALDSAGERCATCGVVGKRLARRFDFGGLGEEAQTSDWLNRIKATAKKRMGRLYPVAIEVLSPVYGDLRVKPFLAEFDLDQQLVCDLGAGTQVYDERLVRVDGYPYESINVVADLSRLPFADNSIDGIISTAVLEHVSNPAAHVAEMLRVLKPGGRVLCYFPFMAGFHASPHDYTRLTRPGLRELFSEFEIEDVVVAGGPTSGLLWTLQEWLAIAGSFGSERVYRALVPLTWALSPLKFLDVFLIKHPAAHVIASAFSLRARKR
jgi:SAM-dependent methyltransferase